MHCGTTTSASPPVATTVLSSVAGEGGTAAGGFGGGAGGFGGSMEGGFSTNLLDNLLGLFKP